MDSPEYALVSESHLFDRAWYLARNADVASAAIDPISHYLDYGWVEGRDPGPDFHARAYLSRYPDVRHAGLEPLTHYLRYGRQEGRACVGYHAILDAFDDLSDQDKVAIDEHIAGFAPRIELSVVVPVYRTHLDHLRQMLASVQSQTYPHWQLCIADDNSDDRAISSVLDEIARSDSRVTIVKRSKTGGISAATNSAISVATGMFLCFLDHDDLLHENALYEIATVLDAYPDTDLIYSDSDLIDDRGNRFDPYFKSDWDPDLLLGHNMVSHFGVYRRSKVDLIGGLRSDYDGSQDYDLALRFSEETTCEQIRHIPSILYHWRQSTVQTSFSSNRHDACLSAARRAIVEHLQRCNIDASVHQAGTLNFTRITYALPFPRPLISVAIRAGQDLDALVTSVGDVVFRQGYEPLDLLVVFADGISSAVKPTMDRLQKIARVRALSLDGRDEHWINATLEAAAGEIVVLLDEGLTGRDAWLGELVAHAARAEIGCVSGTISDATDTLIYAGTAITAKGPLSRLSPSRIDACSLLELTRTVSVVQWRCVAVKRSAFLDVGGMPEDLGRDDAEVSVCGALSKAGLRTIVTPFARFIGPARSIASSARAVTDRAGDPCYNVNLSQDEGLYDLGSPAARIRPWATIKRRNFVRAGQRARAAQLLEGLTTSSRLMEIGASYSPIAPRADGWSTTIVDHASADQLRDKYRSEPDVWIDRIEQVDFVWSAGTIADTIPKALHGTFDALIASHMIEHTPDLIAFLASAAMLLTDCGKVILAVPDKRYCFDYFRPLTTTGLVIEAHEFGATRHRRSTLYDHWAYGMENDGLGAWGQENVGELRLAKGFRDLKHRWQEPQNGDYIDAHAWQFTPASFELIIFELGCLGLCELSIDRITPAIGCEFHVVLEKSRRAARASPTMEAIDEIRLSLIKRTIAELAEQSRFFVGSDQGESRKL